MNESLITNTFQFVNPISGKSISEIIHLISEVEGVEEANVSESEITITYDGYVQTDELLRQQLENAGYKILGDNKQTGGWLKKLVSYISKGNKEAFKGGQPNCCNPDLPTQE
jgi:copper chaperone CopZ